MTTLALTAIQGWTFSLVGLSFALYLTIAWLGRVRDTKGFYVAGQGVPAIANGMATGADWMSAASFLSMAGMIAGLGYAGGVFLMGWTGGFVLLALLLAPYLRKFGQFTVPDFIGDRYESNTARLVAVFCAVFVSFVYVAGQMRGVGIVFSRFLEISIDKGVMIGMAIVFVYAVLGGMKGITWTQIAQYWVLIVAFLIPAIAISLKLTGNPIPSLGMGSTLVNEGAAPGTYLLDKLNAIHHDLGFASYTEPFAGGEWNRLNVFCAAMALMVGTAGLPHIIVRFYTTRTVSGARWSAFWALFFIALLYLTAPAVGAFARYYVFDSLQDKTRETLPGWFNNWEKTGLVLWLDNGDGKVRFSNREDNEVFRLGALTPAEIAKISAGNQMFIDGVEGGVDGRALLRAKGLSGPDKDIMVLALPEMANLSPWIVGLIAAGGLAAALSTASGLLLVVSSSVAHDLYYRIINPKASETQRLLVGRATIGVAVVIAGIFGINPPGFVSEVVSFAFGLAAASFFPIILLGIFSKRVGTLPAVAGMFTGITFTAAYIIGNKFMGMPAWCLGIKPEGIGAVGLVLNFAVTLALTPLCPAPSQRVRDMIDRIREPEGVGPAVKIETAPEH